MAKNKSAAIISKPGKAELAQIVPPLLAWFREHQYQVVVDPETAPLPAVSPTEAEVRATDLDEQETPPPDDREGTPREDDRQDRIRRAAYANYQRRGASAGSEVEDWLDAERSVDDKP